ncbi:MAG: lipase family protein [bacterium]|nr:lipase family protein [bacterium]
MLFDVATAKLTADLSRLAYKDGPATQAGAAGHGLSEFKFFSASSTQAFTAADASTRFLAFRGTESTNPVDWARDAQFKPRPGALGKVHSGFDAALDEVWAQVQAEIAGDTRPLIITGHSLGGGLAFMAAARLADAGALPAAVYVFGCPRTGLSDFRDAYDAALQDVTLRIINHIDLVTRVPLLAQGYRAPGRRMYFDESHTFHPDAGAWHIAKDDLKYRLRHFGRIQSLGLSTHEMGAYMTRVNSL